MKKAICIALAVATGPAVLAIYPDVTTTDFQWVGQIGGSSGVAITRFDVITAKHVGGMTFTLPGVGTWTAVSRINHIDGDLALLRFSTPLPGWHTPLYGDQIGQNVTMVGYGLTGTLRLDGTGYNITGGAGTKRAGMQRVSQRQAVNLGTGIENSVSLLYDLDGNGIDTFADGGPIAGEAGIAGGDSGGGWFRTISGVHRLVGVNSFVFNAVGPGGGSTSDFGDGGGAVDLNNYSQWITANTVPEPATIAALAIGVAALARRRRR